MSPHGELPRIDHAIFADTQWEPKEAYVHLGYLTRILTDAGLQVHPAADDNIYNAPTGTMPRRSGSTRHKRAAATVKTRRREPHAAVRLYSTIRSNAIVVGVDLLHMCVNRSPV